MAFWLILPLPGCCPTPEAGLRLLHFFRSASGRHPTVDAVLQETQKLGSRFRIVGDVLEDVITVSGDLAILQSSDLVQCVDGCQDLKVEVDQEAEERLLTPEAPVDSCSFTVSTVHEAATAACKYSDLSLVLWRVAGEIPSSKPSSAALASDWSADYMECLMQGRGGAKR